MKIHFVMSAGDSEYSQLPLRNLKYLFLKFSIVCIYDIQIMLPVINQIINHDYGLPQSSRRFDFCYFLFNGLFFFVLRHEFFLVHKKKSISSLYYCYYYYNVWIILYAHIQ